MRKLITYENQYCRTCVVLLAVTSVILMATRMESTCFRPASEIRQERPGIDLAAGEGRVRAEVPNF